MRINLLEGPDAFGNTSPRTSGGPVHMRGYTRTVQGQSVMVGDYDRSPPPGGGDQPGQPGSGDQSNEPLPTFPDPDYTVTREPDGTIVAMGHNDQIYVWKDGEWVEDDGSFNPVPLSKKGGGDTGVAAMSEDGDDGGDGGGGDAPDGGGETPGGGGGEPPGGDIPGDLTSPDAQPDNTMSFSFGPDTSQDVIDGLLGLDGAKDGASSPGSLLPEVPETPSQGGGSSLLPERPSSGGGWSGSRPPRSLLPDVPPSTAPSVPQRSLDPWHVSNMANAILGKSGFAGVAQHYQSQAKLDPVGTRAEIHAVTAHMARTDPGHAAAFQQHMAKTLPDLSPKQGPAPHVPADPVVGDAQTPPAWKSGDFAAQPGAWAGFNQAVAGLPNASPTETFAYGQIYAAEGGNIKDKDGSASSGILQKTLDDARSRVPGLENARTPSDLSPAQRAAIYRDYLDQALHGVGGHQALDRIGNIKAATALADTVFRFGTGGGARIVQQAINEIAPGTIKAIDGKMGPETLTAFTRLASNPSTLARLLDEISRTRTRETRGAERDRNDHFRFPRLRQN